MIFSLSLTGVETFAFELWGLWDGDQGDWPFSWIWGQEERVVKLRMTVSSQLLLCALWRRVALGG
jgi:hypothetical protein